MNICSSIIVVYSFLFLLWLLLGYPQDCLRSEHPGNPPETPTKYPYSAFHLREFSHIAPKNPGVGKLPR